MAGRKCSPLFFSRHSEKYGQHTMLNSPTNSQVSIAELHFESSLIARFYSKKSFSKLQVGFSSKARMVSLHCHSHLSHSFYNRISLWFAPKSTMTVKAHAYLCFHLRVSETLQRHVADLKNLLPWLRNIGLCGL